MAGLAQQGWNVDELFLELETGRRRYAVSRADTGGENAGGGNSGGSRLGAPADAGEDGGSGEGEEGKVVNVNANATPS